MSVPFFLSIDSTQSQSNTTDFFRYQDDSKIYMEDTGTGIAKNNPEKEQSHRTHTMMSRLTIKLLSRQCGISEGLDK